MTIESIIGDYKAFFTGLLHDLAKLNIDVQGLPISHICYRVKTIDEYEPTRSQLHAYCRAIAEDNFNGRSIAMLLLKQPLLLAPGFNVSLIELPAPKPQRNYFTGLEHCGFVVGESLPQFNARHAHALTGHKDRGADCQPSFITFENGITAKFYDRPLQEIVGRDGWSFQAT